MSIFLDDDYDPEDEINESKDYSNKEENQMPQKEIIIHRTEPLKILISIKVVRVNSETGKEFDSWFTIGKASLIPGTIKTEEEFCKALLKTYGEHEFKVMTWHIYDNYKKLRYTLEGKKGKKSRGFFLFWMGTITNSFYIRYAGHMLQYVRSSIPLNQRHLWTRSRRHRHVS